MCIPVPPLPSFPARGSKKVKIAVPQYLPLITWACFHSAENRIAIHWYSSDSALCCKSASCYSKPASVGAVSMYDLGLGIGFAELPLLPPNCMYLFELISSDTKLTSMRSSTINTTNRESAAERSHTGFFVRQARVPKAWTSRSSRQNKERPLP